VRPVIVDFSGGLNVEAAIAQIREGLATLEISEGTLLVRVLPSPGPNLAAQAPPKERRDKAPNRGPGTELKKLLAKIGIHATPHCTCNARAMLMDQNEAKEPGWCEANVDTIVGWLREEAGKRGLPFLDAAGRLLVRRAISNARREQTRAEEAKVS
jgi:hypothetical protein